MAIHIPAWKAKRELRRLGTQLGQLPRSMTRLPKIVLSPIARRRYDRSKGQVIRITQGDVPQTNEIAILLIFQPKGLLGSTLHTLTHLRSRNLAPLVVSNAPLSDDDRTRLLPHAWQIMERPNFGYDFGGYRDGILHILDMGFRPSRLFVLNDSVWFPLEDDSDLLDQARASGADLFGFLLNTRSKARERQHIQSYFLRFGGALIARPEFETYWRKLFLFDDKELVIRKCEIPMTDAFRRMGCSVEALFNYADGGAAMRMLDTATLRQVIAYLARVDGKDGPRFGRHLEDAAPEATWRSRVLEDIKAGVFDKYFLYTHPVLLLDVLHVPLLKKDRQAIYRQQRAAIFAGCFETRFAPIIRKEISTWDEGGG